MRLSIIAPGWELVNLSHLFTHHPTIFVLFSRRERWLVLLGDDCMLLVVLDSGLSLINRMWWTPIKAYSSYRRQWISTLVIYIV